MAKSMALRLVRTSNQMLMMPIESSWENWCLCADASRETEDVGWIQMLLAWPQQITECGGAGLMKALPQHDCPLPVPSNTQSLHMCSMPLFERQRKRAEEFLKALDQITNRLHVLLNKCQLNLMEASLLSVKAQQIANSFWHIIQILNHLHLHLRYNHQIVLPTRYPKSHRTTQQSWPGFLFSCLSITSRDNCAASFSHLSAC